MSRRKMGLALQAAKFISNPVSRPPTKARRRTVGIGLQLDPAMLERAESIAEEARRGGWTVTRADVLRAAINAGIDAVSRMNWAPKAAP